MAAAVVFVISQEVLRTGRHSSIDGDDGGFKQQRV